jgi:hypothetical protein
MNSTPATIPTPVLSEARLEAVSLVLPQRLMRPEVPVDVARVAGKVKAKLAKAQRVALTGLHGLSNVGIDAALAWAQKNSAAVLIPALPGMTREDARPVSQHISLAEACKAELVIWVGCDGSSGPVADWLVRHQFLGAVVPGNLASVLTLRAALKKNAFAEPIGQKKRAVIVIGPTVERAVSSQWHHLAADLQTTCRMGVLSLPDIDLTLNGRGLFEAVGVRFGIGIYQSPQGEVLWTNPARITPGVESISKAGAFDLVLDLAPEPTPGIGKTLHVPGLAGAPCLWPGMDAHLTRFDAQTVGLADDSGDSDWAAQLLAEL